MRKAVFLTLLITIFLTVAGAYGADWKYHGASELSKGEHVIAFYDNESVERLPGGNVRVWVKAITEAEWKRMSKRIVNKEEKQTMDKVAEKIVSGYVPPYVLAKPEEMQALEANNIDNIDIIVWEEIADSPNTKPRMKMLCEINCKEKKERMLSISVFDTDGEIHSDNSTGAWIHIAPESNTETLMKILCKTKN